MPLALLCACLRSVSPEEPSDAYLDDPNLVETQMSIAFKPGSGTPSTKMLDSVTQINGGSDKTVFRGIEQVYIIPFGVVGPITATDERNGDNLQLPHTGIAASWGASAASGDLAGLVNNNNSHLYKNVFVRRGTASVLAYGKAIDVNVAATPSDSVDFKRRNGVLRAHGLDGAETPMDMWFELEPIIGAADESSMNTAIQGVLSYLSSIAGAGVSVTGRTSRYGSTTTWTYSWSNPSSYNNHQTLVNAFETLTGSGIAFSGSTKAIEQMLTSVYNGLYNIANSSSNSSSYSLTYYPGTSGNTTSTYYYVYQLAREIRNLINNSSYVSISGSGNNATVSFNSTYASVPARYGVPEGCVAVQWNGTSFVQVSADNSALAPVSSYCYPPSLWYWTNSRLKTSEDESVSDQYVQANTTWSSILANYTTGSIVRPGVASAAVQEPLQYGIAQLRLSFTYATSPGDANNLLDFRGDTPISISNTNYPLTGVLISEQRHQAYNFTPKSGDNYCIFDSDVNDGTNPKVYIASASSGVTLKPVHTLVVQTDNNQDVHYALEFQNNSGDVFYGANGCIVSPGSKFYLIGTLELANATNTTSETINSVFLQDHVTEVRITVKGLAAAYNTIPELRDPQLQIGVQTEMKWVGSTPAQTPMY